MAAPSLEERAALALSDWRRDKPQDIAVDTETEGLAFFDRAFAMTVSWRGPNFQLIDHYIELADDGRQLGHSEIPVADLRDVAREILLGSLRWVFHHSKFDIQKLILAGVLARHEVTPSRIEDTEALAHLDDEHRRKGLKFLSEALFGDTNEEETALKVAMRKNKLKLEDGYHLLPRDDLIPYALADTNKTLRLFEYLEPRVRQHFDLWGLYNHEKDVTMTLLDMESRGMAINLDYVNEQMKRLNREYIRLERELSLVVGKPIGRDVKSGEFNPNSNDQIREYFMGKGIESASYDKHFLPTCTDPFAPLLLEYRSVMKLRNTYFVALRDETRDGVLHPHFRQHGTRTGRMSSGGFEE